MTFGVLGIPVTLLLTGLFAWAQGPRPTGPIEAMLSALMLGGIFLLIIFPAGILAVLASLAAGGLYYHIWAALPARACRALQVRWRWLVFGTFCGALAFTLVVAPAIAIGPFAGSPSNTFMSVIGSRSLVVLPCSGALLGLISARWAW